MSEIKLFDLYTGRASTVAPLSAELSEPAATPPPSETLRAAVATPTPSETLRAAAGILADLANDLERAAAHEGIATAARGEFSAVRTCVIADNIAALRESAGHLRFIAATAFRAGETSAA